MRILYKWLMVFSAAFMLMACGDDGNNFNNTDNTDNAVDGHSVNLSGSATKGTLINANVALYGFENGTAFLLGDTATDSRGDYELTIPSDYRGPAKLVVSAASSGDTTMICDAPAGCGGTPFGQAVEVSPEMKLTAYQREVLPGQSVQLHATPYTHLAATLVDVGSVDAASIAEATRQVADLFDLPGDFSSIKPADVTRSSEVAGASVVELRYSALVAAFAGGDGEAMAQRLADYADSLAGLGGQLAHTSTGPGAPSLEQLYTSARALADQLDSNLLRSEFDSRLSSLVAGQNSAAGSDGSNADNYGELIAAAMDDANHLDGMLSEEALDLYLGSKQHQLDWVLTDDFLPSVVVGFDVVKMVVLSALANDIVVYYADANGFLDMSGLTTDPNMAAEYDTNTQTLHYFSTANAPADISVDLEIDVSPVIDGLLPADGGLSYVLKSGGHVRNSSFDLDFTKDSHVRFDFVEDDDFTSAQLAFKVLTGLDPDNTLEQEFHNDPVVSACYQEVMSRTDVQAGDETVPVIDCVISDFLKGLNGSAELGFGFLLTKADGSQQFNLDFLGYADVDLRDPNAPTLLNLEIRDGHLYAPNGDAIYTLDPEKGLVMNLGNSDNAMFARFGVESTLVPDTEVTVSAQFHDLQDYLDIYNGSPVAFDFNRLRIANLVDEPLSILSDLLSLVVSKGALMDLLDYLAAETTPQDFIDTLNVQLDVQADAQWPERRYQVDFQNDLLEVSNQDGVRIKYSAEPGAIVSRIAVDGTDLVEVRVTEDGVQIIDIDDAVTINPSEIPSERIMAVFARLDVLIDLDQQARDLLNQYDGTASF